MIAVYDTRLMQHRKLLSKIIFQIIKFTVTELKLEFHKTCANDYLEIIDGDHILGKYCGHVDDGIPSSSGNEVTMRLRTNWLGSDKGFSIQYTAVNPPSPSSEWTIFLPNEVAKPEDITRGFKPTLSSLVTAKFCEIYL